MSKKEKTKEYQKHYRIKVKNSIELSERQKVSRKKYWDKIKNTPEFKEKQKKNNNQYYSKNKKKIHDKGKKWTRNVADQLKEYKKSLLCADCGFSGKDHPYVLDFDHLRDKKIVISDMAGRFSFESIMKEIAKCDPVCSNCHRIRTNIRKNNDSSTNKGTL